MKLTNLFGSPDLTEQKSKIRNVLSEHASALFPNGIFGQVGIAQDGKDIVIELPFSTESVVYELNALIKDKTGFKGHVRYIYKPTQAMTSKIENIKMVVAVASGKGGVGKSTVSSNLAVELAKMGHKVGLLDADIYGPSIPMMFGLQGESIGSKDQKTMEPMFKHGVYLNSIGFLLPVESAAIWRGPMASRALTQVITETNWPELDILLVDMPPGTGDIQLTMSENIKCDGAVIITTPQNVALADAEKGIAMFKKVNTPILGLVENMSQFVCDNCGQVHHLFGSEGGEGIAQSHQVPMLAQLPLVASVREAADIGKPYVLNENRDKRYRQLAFSLMMQLSKQTEQVIALA